MEQKAPLCTPMNESTCLSRYNNIQYIIYIYIYYVYMGGSGINAAPFLFPNQKLQI